MKMWRENEMGQVNRGSENQWTARERESKREKRISGKTWRQSQP